MHKILLFLNNKEINDYTEVINLESNSDKITTYPDFNYFNDVNTNNIYIKESLDLTSDESIDIDDDLNVETRTINPQKLPDLYYVGVVAGTYLIFQNDKGMYMIDQHAAQERINYEYYYNIIGDPKIIIREMFIPRVLEVTINDIESINSNIKAFNELGFYFNAHNQLISHPSFILDKDLDQSIDEMLKMLNFNNKIDLKQLLDNLSKDKSCKASIKANNALSRKEVEELIKDLRLTNNPYTCPHGRPTIILLTNYEIEKNV